jgi:hypothetical protein
MGFDTISAALFWGAAHSSALSPLGPKFACAATNSDFKLAEYFFLQPCFKDVFNLHVQRVFNLQIEFQFYYYYFFYFTTVCSPPCTESLAVREIVVVSQVT